MVFIAGVVGYFFVMKKQSNPAPLAADRDFPGDSAMAEITVFSNEGDKLKINIDNITQYVRNPSSVEVKIGVGDSILVNFKNWKDNFQGDDKQVACPTGYNKTPKLIQPLPAQPPSEYPKVGEKYRVVLTGCFAKDAICDQFSGWSAEFYNSNITTLEYGCTKLGTPPVLPKLIPTKN